MYLAGHFKDLLLAALDQIWVLERWDTNMNLAAAAGTTTANHSHFISHMLQSFLMFHTRSCQLEHLMLQEN